MWGGMDGRRGSQNPAADSSVFHEFFGSSSPFGDDIFGSALGAGSSHRSHAHRRRAEKAPAIERKLPCTLEELYNGATKKMKISREIVDASGRRRQEEEILQIDVKPGWKKGTKITFPGRGNKAPDVIPADLVFVIDEKPHPVFTRDGDDLVVTHKLLLAEALTGHTVHPETIDGRSLTVAISSVIHPRYEEVVPGEGMPLPKNPSRKGNLRVRFDIEFPTLLTASQKAVVARVFGLQRSWNKDGHGANKKVVDSQVQCQAPDAANRTAMDATHGESSGQGRKIVYIGSVPVCVD